MIPDDLTPQLPPPPADQGAVCFTFDAKWVRYLLPAVQELLDPDVWLSDSAYAIDEVSNLIKAIVTGGDCVTPFAMPVGSIIEYPAAAAPADWLLCDGSAVSRATYAALFALIGTTYGAGNGTTTFNVPDFRSRIPMGAGTGAGLSARALGDTPGEETHQLTAAELAAHAHSAPTHHHATPIHTHSMNAHTHTPAAHDHNGPSHTHAGPSHVHTGPSHVHAGPQHNHTIAHSHTVPKQGGGGPSTVGISPVTNAPNVSVSGSDTANSGDSGTANTGSSGTTDTGASGTAVTGASGTAKTSADGSFASGGPSSADTGGGGGSLDTSDNISGANTGGAGGDTAHNNIQPSLVVNFIIKI